MKKKLDLVVLSDIHLGTYSCHAAELLIYLQSISPKIMVLNGDIFDIWNFSKNYFPDSHVQVINEFLSMASNGTKIYYLTGNHDEALRRYPKTQIGNFVLDDKLVLEIDKKTIWFFHGDVFDATTKGWARILAKLGGKGYDILILFNRFLNKILEFFDLQKVSISKRIKNGVKQAAKFVLDFEDIAASIAIDQKYDVVVCGHIHQAQIKQVSNEHGSVLYLNSGDWVESCTALEYINQKWTIFRYFHDNKIHSSKILEDIRKDIEVINLN